MTVQLNKLYEVLIDLSKIKDLKATTFSSAKGALLTGVSSLLGGLVLGKYGLLLGGAIGGGIASVVADDFKPVWIILMDLPKVKREELLEKVVAAFENIGMEDVAAIAMLLLKNNNLQTLVIKEISNYLKNEFNLRIM